ncbi:MAG: hypothetical protein ACXVW2_17160 [Nocardioidaceae bacterium]
MGSYGLLVAFLVFLLVLGAVAGLVAWLLTRGARPAPPPPRAAPATQARAVLDDRLARGEIDVAEYRERRAALEQDGPGAGAG